jgi:N-acetylneuraminic acid mutarotase
MAPREGQTVEVFDGKIWLIGGVNYDERKVMNDVWYSEDGLTWYEATQNAPWSGRWDHATAVFKDRIFLVGGMDLSKQAFNDVWATADGIKWELVTDVPPWQTRQGHGLAVLRTRCGLLGGLMM